MYQVIYTARALKSLKTLDKYQAKLLLKWIEKNLINCEDPRKKGMPIKGSLSDWRYRVGSYRILANISDCTVTIEIINVGHRKNIYD